jgi:tRNA pseudouridine55 synthase
MKGRSTRGRAASLRSGVLPVEKGSGVTSFDVVALVRRLLRAGKVGHAGTLDPGATGVLPILLGEATKLMPYLADADKEYVATATLGIATDTQDLSGAVVATCPVPPLDESSLAGVLSRFVGEIDQVPPMYSAVHHEGRRLYEIAREGGNVDRRPRPVVVHEIALEGLTLPDFTVRVRCGKGTYVRTLVADVGAAIGCGAALARLTRTRVGPFALADAVPWAELSTSRDPDALWARLLPPDAALEGRPAVTLTTVSARAFTHGQAAAVSAPADGLVRVYGPDGGFLGVGVASTGTVRPERLLHADPARTSVLPA